MPNDRLDFVLNL